MRGAAAATGVGGTRDSGSWVDGGCDCDCEGEREVLRGLVTGENVSVRKRGCESAVRW